MAIAEKLQELRRKNNLSQEALAEQLGVSRQAVSKWESGISYPETEKILTICRRYGLSADELLLDKAHRVKTGPAPKKRTWLWAVLLAAIILLGTGLVLLSGSAKRSLGQLEEQLDQQIQATNELCAQRDALLAQLEEQASAPPAMEPDQHLQGETVQKQPEEVWGMLQNIFFDFAQRWRLDYIPEFEEGAAPVESSGYLMWAFALNLSNWAPEEKGVMSKSYVEDTVCTHFAVPAISHTPLPKTWSIEGETYIALAAGVNELPVYRVTAFSVREEKGVMVYDVTLTRYMPIDGNIPTEADYLQFRQELTQGVPETLTAIAQERFVFTMGFGGPVFRSHTKL